MIPDNFELEEIIKSRSLLEFDKIDIEELLSGILFNIRHNLPYTLSTGFSSNLFLKDKVIMRFQIIDWTEERRFNSFDRDLHDFILTNDYKITIKRYSSYITKYVDFDYKVLSDIEKCINMFYLTKIYGNIESFYKKIEPKAKEIQEQAIEKVEESARKEIKENKIQRRQKSIFEMILDTIKNPYLAMNRD